MKHLTRWIPLGLDPKVQRGWIGKGLLLGAAGNLRFSLAYAAARRALYQRTPAGPRLLPDAVMEPFSTLLQWGLYGCFAAAAAMAALALYYWRWHYRGSRSIYLMRRLPDRWELWRRCLGLPLLGAGLFLLEALALWLLDLGIYWCLTPRQCLPR